MYILECLFDFARRNASELSNSTGYVVESVESLTRLEGGDTERPARVAEHVIDVVQLVVIERRE